MKNIFITLFFLLIINTLAHSQKELIKGYIITPDFKRINGFIANYGREDSSDKYVFTKSGKDSIFYLSPDSIREFGTDGGPRFIMAEILIEVSDNKVENINDSTEFTLKWIKKKAFIEELFVGSLASLYYYNYNNIDQYYLQIKHGKLIPLIYKNYIYSNNNSGFDHRIIENNAYKQILFNLLKCKNGSKPKKNVNYTRKSLIDFLQKYHECNDANYTSKIETTSATRFNFKASYFASFINYGINDGTTGYYDFLNKVNSTGGLEVEYLLPFNRYILSLFIESSYQYYSGTYYYPHNPKEITVNYKAIELPVGINYYFHLNKNNHIYARAAAVINFLLKDSYLSLYKDDNRYELNSPVNVYVGIGYNFKRLGIEYRYYTTQNITGLLEKNTHDSDLDHMAVRFYFIFARSK